MKRAIILLLDSFGIGGAKDAADFGDEGANTLGHIVDACAKLPRGPLQLPNLAKLGLQACAEDSVGKKLSHSLGYDGEIIGAYGYGVETSTGKDTPSGHWEIAGVPVTFEWDFFPKTTKCFPQELIDKIIKKADLPGVLGEIHSSGTVIINKFGDEHVKTGKPIIYTSADSVLQIAAHEEAFGLEYLYEVCHIARQVLDEMGLNVGRVIARPFNGKSGEYKRTSNRIDLSVPPPDKTLLDYVSEAHGKVISVGKISDIFAHHGVSEKLKAASNDALFTTTLVAMQQKIKCNTLIFTNFVYFDSSFGHRRDIEGYANALEEFDKRLPELLQMLFTNDLLVITADHGCDPTWPGSDHTREHIPMLMFGKKVKSQNLGEHKFSDIGQTIANHLGVKLKHGQDCEVFDEMDASSI